MNKHIGSTLDSLFEELGEKEEIGLRTQKKLLAARIEQVMARRRMTKTKLAHAMRTSRTVVHRLLDPRDTGVTLATIWKASKALGVSLLRVA
jgi:DNA-binding Xre family transcriptional regulator